MKTIPKEPKKPICGTMVSYPIEIIQEDGTRIVVVEKIDYRIAWIMWRSDRDLANDEWADTVHTHGYQYLDSITEGRRCTRHVPDVAETVLEAERNAELWAFVRRLPMKQRNRMIAHYYHGYTQAQIARYEHVDEAAISRSLASARRRLRAMLEE